MRKIGILCLALVLMLGAVGVGFAKWSDMVTIEGIVETGELKVGIHDVGTNDPGDELDPLCLPIEGAPDPQDVVKKHVGRITSENDTTELVCEKAIGGGEGTDLPFYKKITEKIENAYPGYAPGSTILIGNCGTIPVKIDTISAMITETAEDGTVVYDGKWDSLTGFDPALPAQGTMLDDMRVEYWEVDYNGMVIMSGTGLADLLMYLKTGENSQIDPCDYMSLFIQLCFEEGPDNIEFPDDLLPQNQTLEATIEVVCSQWNEVM